MLVRGNVNRTLVTIVLPCLPAGVDCTDDRVMNTLGLPSRDGRRPPLPQHSHMWTLRHELYGLDEQVIEHKAYRRENAFRILFS